MAGLSLGDVLMSLLRDAVGSFHDLLRLLLLLTVGWKLEQKLKRLRRFVVVDVEHKFRLLLGISLRFLCFHHGGGDRSDGGRCWNLEVRPGWHEDILGGARIDLRIDLEK